MVKKIPYFIAGQMPGFLDFPIAALLLRDEKALKTSAYPDPILAVRGEGSNA